MRSVIQIILIIVLTLGAIFGLSLIFSGDREPDAAVETTAEVSTVPETLPQLTQPSTEPSVPETEPAVTFDTVPRYFQTDYPYEPFSEGTVIDSGCSVTCVAMIASYLTDREYTPAQLAYHFNIDRMDNVEKIEYANAQMQLPAVRLDDAQKVYDSLKEGKVAIVMVNGQSVFTTTAHFIVLAGITEDGLVLIHDPLGSIYPEEDVYMTTRFREGFEKFHIFQGFMGAWTYDKKDMPEEPYLYPADLPTQPDNRYCGYRMTEQDRELLAAFLWAEASQETQEVRQAIAEVLLNRVVSSSYPYKLRDVIYKGEYSSRISRMKHAKDLDQAYYDAVDAAMYGPYLLPADVYYFSQWEKSGTPWGQLGSYTFLHSR